MRDFKPSPKPPSPSPGRRCLTMLPMVLLFWPYYVVKTLVMKEK